MNKAELIERMAEITELPKATVKVSLESFVEAVSKALEGGKDVTLTNFGSFSLLTRKPRVGINPSTGKKMQIKEKKVVKFKAGKELREKVAKKSR